MVKALTLLLAWLEFYGDMGYICNRHISFVFRIPVAQLTTLELLPTATTLGNIIMGCEIYGFNLCFTPSVHQFSDSSLWLLKMW